MKKLMYLTLAALLVMSSMALADPGCRGQGAVDRPGWHRPDGQCPGHPMGMRDGGPGLKMLLTVADEINLTDEQKGKLEQMMVDFNLKKVDQRAKIEKAEIRLRALMRDEKANENEVLATIDEVARVKADLHKMRYQHRKEVRSLLTDEQAAKLKELRKARMKKCQGKKCQGQHQVGQQGRKPGGCRTGSGFAPDSDN